MASFEAAVRARLRANAAITQIVGTRVDWGVNAQKAGYPALRLTRVSDARTRHMNGFDGLRRQRVQIDAMALDGPTMASLREAAIAALTASGRFNDVQFLAAQDVSVTGLNEEVGQDYVFRDMIEITLPHMET